MKRRTILLAGAGAALPAVAENHAAALLQRGGLVIAMRHALAPGTFDPPGFRLADCATQRNLSDEGRAQARRIGAWFREQGLEPARVRSSPWCRCLDTARLAFGRTEHWPALGSPHGGAETTNTASLAELQRELVAALGRAGFEVWVTHMFVIRALVGGSAASGEGLLLRAGADGRPAVLARLTAA